MITDKNILASKHTKTEWVPIQYPGWWAIGDAKSFHANNILWEDNVGKETAIANIHMACAAPEAIEFIADLLEDHEKGLLIDFDDWIERAEAILKKAYNFN